MREVQADYDACIEKLRKSMKKVVETNGNHMGYLRAFMAAQKDYFAECQSYLGDMQGESYTRLGECNKAVTWILFLFISLSQFCIFGQ